MMREFVELVRSHIGQAIYVWGGQGQLVESEAQIRRMETSETNALRAIKFWRLLQSIGIDPIWMDDCSGLAVWPLQKLGLITGDLTANGFSRLTGSVPRSELVVGDLVFNLDDEGRAFHMGIVTKYMNGVLYVTEAYGRDRGIIERPITSGYWDDYGHNPFIKEAYDMLHNGDNDAKTGGAVTLWQQYLLESGHKMINDAGVEKPVDGDFGGATENGTENFQRSAGLPVDGMVDNKTWAAMVAWIAAQEKKRADFLAAENALCQKTVTDTKAALVIQTGLTKTEKDARILAEDNAAKQRAQYAEQDLLVSKIRAGRDATNKL